MLGSFVDRLSTLFSKHFLVASFFPTLLAAGVNGLLLYLFSGTFRVAVAAYEAQSALVQAFYGAALLGFVAFSAYVLSTVRIHLRNLLEGEHWPTFEFSRRLVTEPLERGEERRFVELNSSLRTARLQARRMRQLAPVWLESLRNAYATGKATNEVPPYDPSRSEAAAALNNAMELRARGSTIEADVIDKAVRLVAEELEQGDPDKAGTPSADAINMAQGDLMDVIRDASADWQERYSALHMQRDALFGVGTRAPTRLGNIGRSLQSYGETRYGMALAPFWSGLQTVWKEKSGFQERLDDTKAQLDAFVALWWLTAFTTAGWIGPLWVRPDSTLPFLAVTIGGPLIAMSWYELAVRSYLALADIVRCGIDLYRLDLLQALHLGRPRDLSAERRMWEALLKVAGYGEGVNLKYRQPMV